MNLAVSRSLFTFEPLADQREAFYEQRLLLGLAWHCPDLVPSAERDAEGTTRVTWRFLSVPPQPQDLGGCAEPVELFLCRQTPISMEAKCHEVDRMYSESFGCPCCALELSSVCASCAHAVGFHRCQNLDGDHRIRWRRGTLHGGQMDVERALYRLSKKGLALENLRAKAADYVDAGHLSQSQAAALMQHIEAERKVQREFNDAACSAPLTTSDAATTGAMTTTGTVPLTRTQLQAKLTEMEENMQRGSSPGVETDQWRVYRHIVRCLEHGPYLRIMVQASAGTGKSYLLKALCLWCLLHKLPFKAGAPTGIAAANIELPGTDVLATTIHALFGLDDEYKTKHDLAQLHDETVQVLRAMKVLLLDEVSMIDDEFWGGLENILSVLQEARRSTRAAAPDHLGEVSSRCSTILLALTYVLLNTRCLEIGCCQRYWHAELFMA